MVPAKFFKFIVILSIQKEDFLKFYNIFFILLKKGKNYKGEYIHTYSYGFHTPLLSHSFF